MLPANVLKIIDFATMEEDDLEGKGGVEEGMDPASMLRYSYVSCALLCSDVGSITTAMFVPIDGDDGAAAVDPLGRLFECIKRPSLSLRVASNFEKIVESLLVSQRKQFLEWLVPRPENLKFFMQHIGNNSMSEIFRKVLHFADGGDINTSGDGPGVDLWDRTGGSGEGEVALCARAAEMSATCHHAFPEIAGGGLGRARGIWGPPNLILTRIYRGIF